MPVAPIARQPGRLDRKHRTDAAFADRCQQALETGPIDAAGRSTQIIVDDLNASPTELPGAIGEPVLSALALMIVHELIGSRLTDIDARPTREMLIPTREKNHPSTLAFRPG